MFISASGFVPLNFHILIFNYKIIIVSIHFKELQYDLEKMMGYGKKNFVQASGTFIMPITHKDTDRKTGRQIK